MVVACWSPKGGSGTSVVAVSLACLLADREPGALVVDLAGDVPAVLGQAEPEGPGVVDWLGAGGHVPADALARLEHPVTSRLGLIGRGQGSVDDGIRAELLLALLEADGRAVVVDCGRVDRHDQRGAARAGRVLASRAPTSLLVVRPCYLGLRRAVGIGIRPTGAVVVAEPGRALEPADVEEVLRVPVVAAVPWSASIARAVDAGLLHRRPPPELAAALRGAV